jgi:hypothetical protein
MIILIYILFLLKTLPYIRQQTDNTGYFLLKSEKCYRNQISFFDYQSAYFKNGFTDLELISYHRLLPPPFG